MTPNPNQFSRLNCDMGRELVIKSVEAYFLWMSNDTKSEMTQNVKWHEILNDKKCEMTQNVKQHIMKN